MPRCGAAGDENRQFLLGRGKGRQALGWVIQLESQPTPALHNRCCCATAVAPRRPPREGIFKRAFQDAFFLLKRTVDFSLADASKSTVHPAYVFALRLADSQIAATRRAAKANSENEATSG